MFFEELENNKINYRWKSEKKCWKKSSGQVASVKGEAVSI